MDQALANLANRLRWSVSSAVSQAANNLNHVLPGNPVTREYDLIQLIGSGGPGLIWKIYAGVKKSTKQEASIFVLEKRAIDAKIANKKDRDAVIEMLKKGVTQLTKLRHPSVLIVQHPMEESRDSLAFACEPVLGSLANLLSSSGQGSSGDGESPSADKTASDSSDSGSDGYNFYQVELKYGLLQIAEALKFLHNDAKMLHRNLCPECIFVNKHGAWKLGGFDFAVSASNPNSGQPLEFPMLTFPVGDNSSSSLTMPNPDFIAPEYVDSNRTEVETAADLYALGALTYCVFNKGKVLLPTGGQPHSMSRVAKLRAIPITTLNCIPEDEGSKQQIKLLLSIETQLRPDAHQFTQLTMFAKDVQVKTLQYLDALYQWDNLHKSQFYKGLPEILKQMPKRVKIQRVTTALVKEFLQPEMVPFVLPNILMISEEATEQEFIIDIFPHLIPVFQMLEPIQIPYILLQKMELILNKCKTSPDSVKTHILPMMFKCLEPQVQPQIQELCLSTVPLASPHIDYNLMKNHLLPRLKKLCLATGLLSVRVKCLITIGKLLNPEEGSSSSLDKWLIIDEILPLLSQVPTKEPAVIMAILGIIKIATTNSRIGLSKDVIATRVLPLLMPMAIENGLSLPQFRTVMSLIRDLLDQVENEHQSKLEQLQSMKAAQPSMPNFANFNESNVSNSKSCDEFAELFGRAGVTPSAPPADLNNGNTSNGFDPFNLGNSKNDSSSSQQSQSLKMGLSLEEKERIAREKEQAVKFGTSNQPLAPAPSSSASSANQPKDLTSSLISSNLASLSFSTPNSSSLGQLNSLNRNSVNSSPSPLGQAAQPNSMLFGQSTSLPYSGSQNQMGFNSLSSMTGSAPFGSGQLSQAPTLQSNKPQVNLSAFDSLTLPGIGSSGKNKQPMAALGPQSSSAGWPSGVGMGGNISAFPMGQNAPGNASSNQGVKSLSKTDLDEFLS